MKGKLQKISANKDRQDSIQFRIDPEEFEKPKVKEKFLKMRRYDFVKVFAEGEQTMIDQETGAFLEPKIHFQSTNTSISLCILEDGQMPTITFSFENPKVFEDVVRQNLRNAIVDLEFEEGENPYSK